jgi:hypothetical protein
MPETAEGGPTAWENKSFEALLKLWTINLYCEVIFALNLPGSNRNSGAQSQLAGASAVVLISDEHRKRNVNGSKPI